MSVFSEDLLATFGDDYLDGDIALTPGPDGGDLAFDERGDLLSLNWADNLRASLIRRLNTPLGSIASLAFGTEGLLVLNETYGNPAHSMISEPLTPVTISRLRAGVQTCLEQEDRIDLLEVGSRLENMTNRLVLVLDIVYAVRDSGDRQVLSVGTNQASGVFEVV